MQPSPVHMSERIQNLIARRHDYYDRTQIPTRRPHYVAAFEEFSHESKSLQIAHGFQSFLQSKKILICEHDILAGFAYRYTYKPSSPFNVPDDYDPMYRPPAGIDTFEEAEAGIRANCFADNSPEAVEMRTFAQCVSKWLYKHWESGHIIPGFERLLKRGYGSFVTEAKEQLGATEGTVSPAQSADLHAMRICADAAGNYISRYADYAADLIQETHNPMHKAQLIHMERALRNIAFGKPSTFFEAVQLIWLTHEMLYAENFPASLSFGRMDQYLYPFYIADLEKNIMTKDDAKDIIDAFWVKLGITLHGYQNITIGGLGPDGKDASNELTLLMIQACRKTLFDQPLLCLRYHKSMPDAVWAESVELLKTGIGLPAFFIDDFCIDAKRRMGHSEQDALNYALVGCVEMSCPGKEYAKTEALRVNAGKILEIMFFNGKSTCEDSGMIVGNSSMPSMALSEKSEKNYTFPLFSHTRLEDIHSFEALVAWYKEELSGHLTFTMNAINRLDSALPKCYPTPFLSVLMEDCLQKGMDVTAGGAVYNNTGLNLCGLANVVDSLAAVRQLVFETQRYSLQDFKAAMLADFVGHEELWRDIQNCPKFGNDVDSVDHIMAALVASAGERVCGYPNPRGGHWQLGLYSVEDHVKMGIHTGALPDGKRNGQALASAISPVQGKDIVGPTAAINSLVKTDLSVATNGMVLDIKFSPSFFDKEKHAIALRMLLQSYAEQGGGEIQFNVVDRATLQEAQKNPKLHQNLVVRVSGFSAYFTSLIKETQDEIIARTEYSQL